MNQLLFQSAIEAVQNAQRSPAGIGTLGEKTLHAVLKHYLDPDPTHHEIRRGRYYADIVHDEHITEIQTRSFNALRPKLTAFLAEGPVTLVYPVAAAKWLCWVDPETGESSPRRKSPRRGSAQDIFPELYKIKPFLTHENLSLHILLLEIEEYRLLNGWSHDKKKGSTRYERLPLLLLDEIKIETLADYQRFLPPRLNPPFTAKDYARAARITPRNAQTAVHILHHVGTLKRIGKAKNAYLYDFNTGCQLTVIE